MMPNDKVPDDLEHILMEVHGADGNPEIRHVTLDNIKLGPIRRESLADDQVEHLRLVYKSISPYVDYPFEQFELNFLREAHPEREIVIWSRIAAALLEFVEQQPQTTNEQRRAIFAFFLLISTGGKKSDDIDGTLWNYLETLYVMG